VSGAGCSRVTHPFATDPPSKLGFTVRLACVKHAASVRPEPESNSPSMFTRHQPTEAGQQQTQRTDPKVQSDSASKRTRQPTGWAPHPNLNHQPTPQHGTGHMASTTWHTVEFSRNRRASPRDLAIPSQRLVCSPRSPWRSGGFATLPDPRGLRNHPCELIRGLTSQAADASRAHEAPLDQSGVAACGTSHRFVRGVRSSLPGDLWNITRMLPRSANRCRVTPVTWSPSSA
jgi:hypothetical protein